METTKFYYRKPYYYARTIVALIFAGFLVYFVYSSYKRFLPDPSSKDSMETILFYFFVTIISLMAFLILYLLIGAAKLAFLSAPALAMDREKLVVNGKRKFAWSEIDYIKYVKGRVLSSTGRRIHGHSVYYLHIKPKHGRKIKVDITQIDEQHIGIFDALRAHAPKLDIKGWRS